jgi:hypothetical protein
MEISEVNKSVLSIAMGTAFSTSIGYIAGKYIFKSNPSLFAQICAVQAAVTGTFALLACVISNRPTDFATFARISKTVNYVTLIPTLFYLRHLRLIGNQATAVLSLVSLVGLIYVINDR